MAGEKEPETFDTGGVFTFGRSRFAENIASQFYIRNDPIVELACGDEHTVCICEKGRVFVFGSNDYGQLGLGHKNVATKPTCVKTLKPQKSIHVACGRAHTIVTTEDGKVYSWGCNSDGQLGLGDTIDRYLPTVIDTFNNEDIVQLSAGSQYSAALTRTGKLYTWGNNTDGQIGIPDHSENVLTPTLMPFEQPITFVSCGYYHMGFITEDGSLYVCGEGESGKLGLSDTLTSVRSPRRVNITSKLVRVSCGGSHSAAVTADGRVYSFGSNFSGQLGVGIEVTQSNSPAAVHSLDKARIAHVSCGESHTAFVTRKGHLYMCGDGKYEKLCIDGGSNANMKQFTPMHITRFKGFKVESVTCGGCHTMVLANRREGDNDLDEISQSNESDSEESLVSVAQRLLPPLQRLPTSMATNINNNIEMNNLEAVLATDEQLHLEDEIVNKDSKLNNDDLIELSKELEAVAMQELSEIEHSESDEDIRLADEKTAEMKSDDEDELNVDNAPAGVKEGEQVVAAAEEGAKRESRVSRFLKTFRRKKLTSAQSASEERITSKLDTTDINQRAVSEGVRRKEDSGGGDAPAEDESQPNTNTTAMSGHRKSKTCVII